MPLTLHGFASTLLSDPHAMAAYELDPQGELDRAGLADITPQDVQDIIPLVTEYGSFGSLGAGPGTGFATGGLRTDHGDYQATGMLDLAGGGDLAHHLDLTTPDGGGLGLRAGEDGAGTRGRLATDDGTYEGGGSLDLAGGPGGSLWMSTPDGSFAMGATPDGLSVGGDAAFARYTDQLDGVTSELDDVTGMTGAGSVAGLLSSGADLGAVAGLAGGLGGGLGNLGGLGGGAVDQLDATLDGSAGASWDDSLGDTGLPVDGLTGLAPVDGLPVGGDGLGLPDLSQLPLAGGLGLPAMPHVGQLPAVSDVDATVDAAVNATADATVAGSAAQGVEMSALPTGGMTDGLTDSVSGSPAGDLLADAGHATDGAFGLDEHLPL